MKTIILIALCTVSLTSCRCDLPEDEENNKSEAGVKTDTLKIK